MRIPRRYRPIAFGILQSGVTSFVSTGAACIAQAGGIEFAAIWLKSWICAWALVVPIVIIAAGHINRALDCFMQK